ncbi:MAG: hypothetical protein VW405_22035, partial [Rhodospirillaceae bacterium]
IVPFINVTDIDPKTGVQKYRFWGTALSEIHGGDFTGMAPSDVPPFKFGDSAQRGHERLTR